MARGGKRVPNAGGRPVGSRSKSVIERDRLVEEQVERDRSKGVKSGLDTLIELRNLALGYATQYQPSPPGMPPNSNANEKKFVMYVKMAAKWSAQIAEYQSPKLRAHAVVLAPPPPPRPGNVIDMPLDTIGRSRLYQRVVNGKQ